jgi:hypothetical protein
MQLVSEGGAAAAITVQSNSRTWASRTVEATPSLVTRPVT